jgi:predicted N-acyltransferase
MEAIMRTEVIQNISYLQPEKWETLTGGSFYASYAWMCYQQTDPASESRYVLVWDDSGELLAATPVYLVEHEASARYDPTCLFPQLPQHGGGAPAVRQQRTLLVGNRRGYANRLLVKPGRNADVALRLLLAAVNEIAAEEANERAWWLYLTEDDIVWLNKVGTGMVLSPWLLAADFVVTLPGESFDEYLAMLSKNARRQVRKDRATFAAAGYKCTTLRLDECWRQVSPLIASHQRWHGHTSSDEIIRDLMHAQAMTTGAHSRVYGCSNARQLVACAITFATSAELVARAFGFDHAHGHSACEYFELMYYRPIEYAYQHGMQRLHLGIGTLQAKIRRGARVRLLWGIATGSRIHPSEAGIAETHNAAYWHVIVEQLGNQCGALIPSVLPAAQELRRPAVQ